jgi:hypothetical protein
MGPITNYPAGLVSGIRREGSAEVVEGIGFESLDGKSKGMMFDRVMVYVDRGMLIGFDAVGYVRSRKDLGFAQFVNFLKEASGVQAEVNRGDASFTCEEGKTLTVSTREWDDGKDRIHISFKDPPRVAEMQRYIKEYCADPARRRPQDSCKQSRGGG